MCFCCCTTRKSILIYAIVISCFAFIYGIVAISNFGSKTAIYKALIQRMKILENQSSDNDSSSKSNTNSLLDDYEDYYYNWLYKKKYIEE